MSELRKHVADGSCRKKKRDQKKRHTTSDDDDFVDMGLHLKKKKAHRSKREEDLKYDDMQ